MITRIVFYGLVLTLAWWAPSWLSGFLVGALSVVAALDAGTEIATHRHRQQSAKWRQEDGDSFVGALEGEVENGNHARQD